ncbi:protein SMALL AUXIN UP-REGULATED RNA 12-like [Aristolochia californica]|uniref:protein SMALL AUXIN UP-REGULATED RNA 12-like n=1 Tax=Aristolochia californica TaxID=171875 RepID=UPI0035DF8999
MPLRRMKLTGALKKLQPKSPSSSARYGHKVELQPESPTSTLVFGEVMELSDDEASPSSVQSLSVPADVPEGFFAVCVGEERKRYVIPLNYLKLQAFVALLSRAEEEFGFSNSGAIRLPCDTVFFEHLLWLVSRQDPSVQSLEMDELLQFYQ